MKKVTIKGLYIFPNTFLSQILLGLSLSKDSLRSFLRLSASFVLLNFIKDPEVLFLKYTLSKYDRFGMTFLKALVIYGAWFARTTLGMHVSFKTLRKYSKKMHTLLQIYLKVYSEISINPFNTRKIEKLDFWDANNSTNFKHQYAKF